MHNLSTFIFLHFGKHLLHPNAKISSLFCWYEGVSETFFGPNSQWTFSWYMVQWFSAFTDALPICFPLRGNVFIPQRLEDQVFPRLCIERRGCVLRDGTHKTSGPNFDENYRIWLICDIKIRKNSQCSLTWCPDKWSHLDLCGVILTYILSVCFCCFIIQAP